MDLRREEIKKLVKKKFHEGQRVTIILSTDIRKTEDKITVNIKKFYPGFVQTERKCGVLEGYSYLDILQRAMEPKKKEITIPGRIKKRKRVG